MTNPSTSAGHAAQSTYYRPGRLMRALRFGLGASQRLWPALGVRAAYRVFGTPLPPKWLYRGQGPGADWRHEAWSFEDASVGIYHLAAQDSAPNRRRSCCWCTAGAGMRGRCCRWRRPGRRGLRPVLLELPAHGRSAGTATNGAQFARAIDYVDRPARGDGHALAPPWSRIRWAPTRWPMPQVAGCRPQRIVLLAPPASPREYTRYFAHAFGLSEPRAPRCSGMFEAREGVLMQQFEPAASRARASRSRR
jgi:hypothetical protein